jgi:hypothetical protein
MTPEYEQKYLREYLEIIRNPKMRYARYNRINIGLWLATFFLAVVFLLSTNWDWFDSSLRPVIVFLIGAFFAFAYTISYSLAQQPLIAKYMDGAAIEKRLQELDA